MTGGPDITVELSAEKLRELQEKDDILAALRKVADGQSSTMAGPGSSGEMVCSRPQLHDSVLERRAAPLPSDFRCILVVSTVWQSVPLRSMQTLARCCSLHS